MSKQKIGFIGVGVMGASIVKHLLKDGYEVNVYNRTKSKADEVVSLGAIWQDTPKAVTIESDIVFTIVGYPKDVEEVYYSEDGIFAGATSEKILVDMTTSTPSLAQKIFATGRERKLRF